MNIAAICHRGTREFIYPAARNQLVFRLSAARADIAACRLLYWKRSDPYPESVRFQPLDLVYRDALHDDFRTTVRFNEPVHYIKYYFELTGKDGEVAYVTDYGLSSEKPDAGFFEFLYANEEDVLRTPDWAKGIVFYQIFPDRFCHGGSGKRDQTLVPWDSIPTYDNYFGGDLRGILEKLDYLSELGVDCIYFTPVFKAEFNHKYATTDYYSIDPGFGAMDDFVALVEKAHAHGIKIILDGVFNHVGRSFPPFADLLENGEKSPYKDWFFYSSLPLTMSPLNYECVGDYAYMPKLRTSHPDVRRMILDVMLYWIEKTGIDGWRLDVADEVERATWQVIRTELKRRHPGALLLGETWTDAYDLAGSGDQMDSAMNYLFRSALIDWVAKGNILPTTFDSRINRMLSKYSDELNSGLYNPIDSHDTARFLYEAGGDKNKLRMAAAFQMTFCGAPAVYYGDEVGMSGANDPDCRGGMLWDASKQDQSLLAWYKKLIRLRHDLPALRFGTFRSILCDDGDNVYGFIRQYQGETVYVVFNLGSAPTAVTLPLLDGTGRYGSLLDSTELVAESVDAVGNFYNSDITDYNAQTILSMGAWSVQIIIKE